MSYGEIVLSYGDCVVRDSDFKVLSSNQWLTDSLIGFFLEYLQDKQTGSASKLKFIGPEVAQLLKLLGGSDIAGVLGSEVISELGDADAIFLPVNDSDDPEAYSGGSHWSLLTYSRGDDAFIHFDSNLGTNLVGAMKMTSKLVPFVSKTATFKTYQDCQLQANSYDCGLHVISNVVLISEYILLTAAQTSTKSPKILVPGTVIPTAKPQDATNMRSELKRIITSLIKK